MAPGVLQSACKLFGNIRFGAMIFRVSFKNNVVFNCSLYVEVNVEEQNSKLESAMCREVVVLGLTDSQWRHRRLL